jgi:hypothetical protein
MEPKAMKPTREERLAAKLRENLHRRKAQARGFSDSESNNLSSRPAAGRQAGRTEQAREGPGEGLPEGTE